MTQITIEIPDELFSQLETEKESLQDILINALKIYLKTETSDITNTKTWELCGSLEILNTEDRETGKVTNYAENVDEILYS